LVVSSRKQKSDEIHVGLSWSEGIGKYKLTKVITIAPRFLLKNNLPEAISFREHGVAPRDRSVIKSGERCPLHVIRMGEGKLLTIAFSGLNTQWLVCLPELFGLILKNSRSPPINIEDIGSVHFRLRIPDDASVRLIRADIQISGPTIFITFAAAGDGWPFMIENESDYTISFCQQVRHP
jgi:vacuolar protein sorting-associated protein 13A/C